MSATENPQTMNFDTVVIKVENYLVDAIEDGEKYFKSRDIADDLNIKTKRVAMAINKLKDTSPHIAVEKWGYSSSTTWLITQESSPN